MLLWLPYQNEGAPLHFAARKGHAEVCALLIERGAHCDAKASAGEVCRFVEKNPDAVI